MSWGAVAAAFGLAATLALAVVAPACTSNPTPYPGQPDVHDDQAAGDGALSPDPGADQGTCERLGGAWIDGACVGATAETPDAAVGGTDGGDTDDVDGGADDVDADTDEIIDADASAEPGPG